jgi:DNA repair protein RecN (Recombination protein N)
LDQLSERLTELVELATDLGAELAAYQEQLEVDPQRLAAVHERRASLSALARKYGPTLSDVLAWTAEAQERLAASDTSEEAIAALTQASDAAAQRYLVAAEQLSSSRRAAAAELSAKITHELVGLAMGGSAIAVTVRDRAPADGQPRLKRRDQWVGASADGLDEVEMTLRSHPEAPVLPIQRGASGGELSRVMLAVEVVLAGTDSLPTMVFDEVVAGVGGRAAVEVGRTLARLADKHQVIVVTHLAQVAAFADQHLVVDKGPTDNRSDNGVTRSDIRAVTGDHRLAELARMLSGADTSVAREHAAELLAGAKESHRFDEGVSDARPPSRTAVRPAKKAARA